MRSNTVREVMTPNPATLSWDESVSTAAKLMREMGIGDILVMSGGQCCGILTDRDIVVRCIAEGLPPEDTPIGKICSTNLVAVEPNTPVDSVISMMRERSLRRIVVLSNGEPHGIVTLGDVAIDRDLNSVLAEISSAKANT